MKMILFAELLSQRASSKAALESAPGAQEGIEGCTVKGEKIAKRRGVLFHEPHGIDTPVLVLGTIHHALLHLWVHHLPDIIRISQAKHVFVTVSLSQPVTLESCGPFTERGKLLSQNKENQCPPEKATSNMLASMRMP